MKTQFKDVAHLYLGCEMFVNGNPKCKVTLAPEFLANTISTWANHKPILYPLSAMTEEQTKYAIEIGKSELDTWKGGAKRTAYLLSQHFDLFNLIESGQALDATQLLTGRDANK